MKRALWAGIFVLSGILTLAASPVFAQSPNGSNRRDIAEKTTADGDYRTDFLDKVYFGDEESEGDRVSVTNAPVVEGGLKTPARAVAPENGEIVVELACDSEKQTLLTLRLWADNPGATHLQAAVEGKSISTRVRVSEPSIPGRFYYVTIGIPTDLTAGKDSVEVTLTAGNNSPDHAFAAYTHVENFYAPPADETQGEPLEAPEPSAPDFDKIREYYLAKFEAGVEQCKRWQNFDDPNNSNYGKVRRGHRPSGNAPGIFAHAYNLKESRYYKDEEMIRRALAAFDYECRKQGYRGVLNTYGGLGLVSEVGGPDRSGTGHGLEGGYAVTVLAESFLKLIPILEEHPEFLKEKIDHDADGEATVTRREAYTKFWRRFLWENALPRFGMSQKAFNQITMWAAATVGANEVLKWLSPEDAAPEDIILKQARAKVGLLPIDDEVVDFILELQTRNDGEYGYMDEWGADPDVVFEKGRYYESRHWHWSAMRHQYMVSPKGLGIEFGWTPGYSVNNHITHVERLADDHRITDKARQYFEATQHMLYPTLGQTGSRWGIVGAIGSRNPGWDWGSSINWAYPAIELDHEPSKRIYREQLCYRDFDRDTSFNFGKTWSIVHSYKMLERLPEIREWYENEEPTDYRLPTEREGPYAWVDEMVGIAMIQDANGTYYVEGMDPAAHKNYHRITPTYRAFGDVKADFSQAAHVETISVGPYEIAMNRSNHRDVRVEGGPRVYVSDIQSEGVVDLISGEAIDPSVDQVIDPSNSLVLDRRRQADAGDSVVEPELTSQAVDEETRTVHWEWNVPEGYDRNGVLSLPLGDSDATAHVARYYRNAVTLKPEQWPNGSQTLYRPEHARGRMPITLAAPADEELEIENIDGFHNRLVLTGADTRVSKIRATGLLPTFDNYNAWDAETTGLSGATVKTDDALEVRVEEGQDVSSATPVTFTLPIEKPVTRIVFTHESNWDSTSSLRTVLETEDGDRLWEEAKPWEVPAPKESDDPRLNDEMVNLEDKHVEDALQFKVVNTAPPERGDDVWYRDMTAGGENPTVGETTTIGDDWFRRIRDIRIEYADGTARYPYR